LANSDGLVNRDRLGHILGVQQLPHSDPQYRPVDGGQPLQVQPCRCALIRSSMWAACSVTPSATVTV